MLLSRFSAILRGLGALIPTVFFCHERDMKWSLALWGMIVSTMLALLSWGAVIFVVNPEGATPFEWTLFLLLLLFSLSGACSTIVLLLRRIIGGVDHSIARIGTSVRQGVFLALFLLLVAMLFRAGWFAWWNALFVFGFLFLIELFFLRKFRMKQEKTVL